MVRSLVSRPERPRPFYTGHAGVAARWSGCMQKRRGRSRCGDHSLSMLSPSRFRRRAAFSPSSPATLAPPRLFRLTGPPGEEGGKGGHGESLRKGLRTERAAPDSFIKHTRWSSMTSRLPSAAKQRSPMQMVRKGGGKALLPSPFPPPSPPLDGRPFHRPTAALGERAGRRCASVNCVRRPAQRRRTRGMTRRCTCAESATRAGARASGVRPRVPRFGSARPSCSRALRCSCRSGENVARSVLFSARAAAADAIVSFFPDTTG